MIGFNLKKNIHKGGRTFRFSKAGSIFFVFVLNIVPSLTLAQTVKTPKVIVDDPISIVAHPLLRQQNRSPEYVLRHDKVREAMRMGRIVPLSQIKKAVVKKYKGKIIGIKLFELSNKKRPYIYNIKLVTLEGELISVTLDARSAKILSVKGKK